MAPSGAWFVAVAVGAAVVLALLAYLVVDLLLGASLSLLGTVVTAAVVGTFLSLLLLAPRDAHDVSQDLSDHADGWKQPKEEE